MAAERRIEQLEVERLTVDPDLRAIVVAALDLAYYRTQRPEIARDLAASVYFELADRVRELPEAKL